MIVAVARSLAFAALFVVAVVRPAAAGDSKAILLVHTYGYDTLARVPFDAAFSRAVRVSADPKIDLYIETLDTNRFRSEAQAQQMRRYLRERYADKPIAVVAAAYDRALGFLREERDPLFPGVPTVALLTGPRQSLPDQVSIIWSGGVYGGSAALALKLQPGARQIAFVDAPPRGTVSDPVYTETLTQVERAVPNTPVIALRNLPLDELIARVSTLPADTPIVVARQLLGRGGEAITTLDAVGELARTARSPIYVGSDEQIGSGATGGIVVSAEREATQLAALALRIAKDGSLRVPPAQSALVPTFDWRQLQRWGIDQARLPGGSITRFRELSAWEQYRRYILAATTIVALQSALIAGLVLQRARRRRSELELRASEAALRQAYGQNQDLAGRLINAQEAERTRIARDLHDDVSQQLAGVGIMLSGLRRKIGKSGSEADLDRTVVTLQDRTSALAEAIRTLSHQLHPSVLEHVGLEATLRRHCADVEELYRLNVVFSTVGSLESPGADVALCLFRVTQEALANAVRHAHARNIAVELIAANDTVQLRITDDGIGFVAGERTGRGLGLRSIDERLRLVHGSFSVESQPGHGATVHVRIPIPPVRQTATRAAGESARRA